MAPALLFYCRAGFEPDLAAELVERSAAAGEPGHARAERGSGHVLFSPADPSRTDALDRALPFASLVFARQKLRVVAELRELPPRDRISPLLAALEATPGLPDRFGQLWTEHPDADQARPLAGLARSFGNAFRPALRRAGHLAARDEPRAPRLHACFLAGDHVLLATSRPDDGAPWLMGIPRLRLHADAPSRSALKLEEALLVLLDDRARASLAPGMHAADLGAAPGGWTWVLVRHHLRVAAIDNGPMQPALMDSGLVEHLRADGFTWQPPRPLDWMVCDMVEQPRRVAARMADWLRNGWCRRTVFNLKLPMRKRWQETRDCLAAFRDAAGGPVDVRARQLFHDREEVTVFARPAG